MLDKSDTGSPKEKLSSAHEEDLKDMQSDLRDASSNEYYFIKGADPAKVDQFRDAVIQTAETLEDTRLIRINLKELWEDSEDISDFQEKLCEIMDYPSENEKLAFSLQNILENFLETCDDDKKTLLLLEGTEVLIENQPLNETLLQLRGFYNECRMNETLGKLRCICIANTTSEGWTPHIPTTATPLNIGVRICLDEREISEADGATSLIQRLKKRLSELVAKALS